MVRKHSPCRQGSLADHHGRIFIKGVGRMERGWCGRTQRLFYSGHIWNVCLHGAGNLKTENSFGLTADSGDWQGLRGSLWKLGHQAYHLCTRWALFSGGLV